MARTLTPAALKRRREALGLTQAALAEHLGVRSNTVARWERGELEMGMPNAIAALLTLMEQERDRSRAGDVDSA